MQVSLRVRYSDPGFHERCIDGRIQTVGGAEPDIEVANPGVDVEVHRALQKRWAHTLLIDKLLLENSLQRYSIGDRTEGITKNDDGSLTIKFGHDEPAEWDLGRTRFGKDAIA